jgi:outer membrane protein OmpA-like peptidoglycan-associated protein
MSHTRLLPCLALVLLSACATLPGTPDATPSPRSSAPSRPAIDWVTLRATLAPQLSALPGISVQPLGEALMVRIPAADGFASGQAALQPSLVATLERLAPVLAQHPQVAVDIIGHTDSIGSELFNLRLSIERAEAVMEHLRSRGIALLRLSADGRGEAEPVAYNGTEEGRAANRRVELILRPLY